MMCRFANLITETRSQDDLSGVFVSMIDCQCFPYACIGAARSLAEKACFQRATYLAEGLLTRYDAANLCGVECKNGQLWFPNPNIEILQQCYQNDPF